MPVAIDVHVHPPNPSGESLTSSKEAQQYFRTGPPPTSAQEVADYYSSLDMMAVIFDIDSETATGRPPTPNDYFADLMKQHPKQFIGFGRCKHSGWLVEQEDPSLACERLDDFQTLLEHH